MAPESPAAAVSAPGGHGVPAVTRADSGVLAPPLPTDRTETVYVVPLINPASRQPDAVSDLQLRPPGSAVAT